MYYTAYSKNFTISFDLLDGTGKAVWYALGGFPPWCGDRTGHTAFLSVFGVLDRLPARLHSVRLFPCIGLRLRAELIAPTPTGINRPRADHRQRMAALGYRFIDPVPVLGVLKTNPENRF